MDIQSLYEPPDLARLYKTFRPQYPVDMYDAIAKYWSEKGDTPKLALDVACGTGQNTIALTHYFDHVIGIDFSEAQIAEAKKTANKVKFQVL